MRGLGLLILRLSMGVVFIAHGLPTFFPVSGITSLMPLGCLKHRESRPPTRWLLAPVSSNCWRGFSLS